jgi:hypothetical protein
MQCQKHKELLERWWNDQLTERERADLKAQLAECEDCQRELEGSRELWDLMGYMPVPEPSGEMQANFNAMLDSYKASVEGRKKPSGIAGLWQLFSGQPWLAAAFSLLLIAGGFGLGYIVNRPAVPGIASTTGGPALSPVPPPIRQAQTAAVQPSSPVQPATGLSQSSSSSNQSSSVTSQSQGPSVPSSSSTESRLEALSAQLHEMREMVMLSLLQNPSASERMRAVSYTSGARNVNPNIATALLMTLNNDPNVNVRLTTLEALTHFAGDPVVREGLVQSILHQESPLVQSALADVMLKLQEKRAVRPFKKLLQQKDLNEMVRDKIEQTISRLT